MSESSSDRDCGPRMASGPTRTVSAPALAQARRISYFMLFRLAMLAMFTVLAGIVYYAEPEGHTLPEVATVWATLVAGYGLTITWARMLPRVKRLVRFAAFQTACDIALAAIAVAFTGGADSGFATLYLIAVLGAAVMGGPRATWYAAGAGASLYLLLAGLEQAGHLPDLMVLADPPTSAREHWSAVTRTLGGLGGVAVLSSYLNDQLDRSVYQVGNLRALNENIVRSINSGLMTSDLEGRILYFNPMARTILDLSDADIGTAIEGLMPGLTTDEDSMELRQDVEAASRTGRMIQIGLTRSPLIDADGRRIGYVVNFQDVTRLHELAQQVRRNERLAALGGMAASVAHEIRNPLAAISGSAELLGSVELAADDARLLRVIRRETGRLSTLIDDLLAFTRPRPPQPVPLRLDRAAQEVCEAFRADPAASGIEVICLAEAAVIANVDPAQISQVLWNLMRNACDAMAGRGKLTVHVNADENRAYIEVHDEGCGIPPEHLDSIFDPFFTTKDAGTGFGLAIVHRVVEENGGRITATSDIDRGSTFSIALPLPMETLEPSDSGVLEIG